MKIGAKIREYRKMEGLTQEEVAVFLGVSASAVNKWENNISYPDITLLAPLASLLKTDINTLLSFREELTDEEVDRIVASMTKDLAQLGYEETFLKYRRLIREHSESVRLVYSVAVILSAWLSLQEEEIRKKYEGQIDAWMESVSDSGEGQAAEAAACILCNQAIREKNYEKAQEMIDGMMPVSGMDKRLLQGNLYLAQERYQEAYALYESMIYQKGNEIVSLLQTLLNLECRTGEEERAADTLKRMRTLIDCLQLPKYLAWMAVFLFSCERKAEEESLNALKRMIQELKRPAGEEVSFYRHCEMRNQGNGEMFLKMLKELCEKDESLDFLRGNPEFDQVMKLL